MALRINPETNKQRTGKKGNWEEGKKVEKDD